MVVPDGAAEEDLAPGSQSHPRQLQHWLLNHESQRLKRLGMYLCIILCRFWMLSLMEQILVPELFSCL